jgi:hypothetical protein
MSLHLIAASRTNARPNRLKHAAQSRGWSDKQLSHPVRAAHAIVDAVESPNPPYHLLPGNAAYDLATAKLDTLRNVSPIRRGTARR